MNILDKAGTVLVTMESATLRGADLRDANLEGATLRGADLEGADLRGADLEGALATLGITPETTLPQRILDQVMSNPESWDQTQWHNACGTKHCIAGWACQLSGPLGQYLDHNLGTATAATLLLWHPTLPLPSFDAYATEDETLGRLRALAEAYAAMESI